MNWAIESELSPIIMLATSRGMSNIQGTNYQGPQGVPLDQLDQPTIMHMPPYTLEELKQILQVLCMEEQVKMMDNALELLT